MLFCRRLKSRIRSLPADQPPVSHQPQPGVSLLFSAARVIPGNVLHKLQEHIRSIFPKKFLISPGVDRSQIIGIEKTVRGNLSSRVGVIRYDPGKETVILSPVDPPAAHTLAVKHSGSENGELDGASHRILIKRIIITRKQQPGFSVIQFQTESQPGVRVGENIPHNYVIVFMDLQTNPSQTMILAENTVVKVPDSVVKRNLLKQRTVVQSEGAHRPE